MQGSTHINKKYDFCNKIIKVENCRMFVENNGLIQCFTIEILRNIRFVKVAPRG